MLGVRVGVAAPLQVLPACWPGATGIPIPDKAQQQEAGWALPGHQKWSHAQGEVGVALGRWSWGWQAPQGPQGVTSALTPRLGITFAHSIGAHSLSAAGTAEFSKQPKLPIQEPVIPLAGWS